MDRSAQIKKVSLVGIGTNLVLSAFKAFVGAVSGSIAIILDAVNNLTDALSSGITLLGAILSDRKPDKNHPFGYGRVEYLSSMLVAVVVLVAGISSIVEAAQKIADPQQAHYSWVAVTIIVVALVVKILLGLYVRREGSKISSEALKASGSEALADAALSASTLVAVVLTTFWGISIEGYIGLVISALIIKAGVDLMLGTLSHIVGKRAQGQLASDIKAEIKSVKGVLGVYDLVLHDYGPGKAMGSVHVELPDDMDAVQIHKISKKIQAHVMRRYNAMLTVGIYASNNTDPQVLQAREFVSAAALSLDGVSQVHGFLLDEQIMAFDIVVEFGHDPLALKEELEAKVSARYPDKKIYITIDKNYTE
ncbi:MAG: cation diffusion facilitator family transporter [Bacteroidales bacterium]|nr:cation diffusion facilitator family transporter [Bacteroidales bacterium]